MNGRNIELDLLTQQFIVHRWHTTVGREVRDAIIARLKSGEAISELLDLYVLKHPANVESYEYPYYPPDAMMNHDFWVLANDDLRGIHFYEEDFSGTDAFSKVNLSYSYFSMCRLHDVSFELADLSHVTIRHCDLENSVFKNSNCVRSHITDCNLQNVIFTNGTFKRTDFSGSDLRGAYFEGTRMRRIKVNYLTRFDKILRTEHDNRQIEQQRLPDLYRSLRLAYEREELNRQSDHYLMRESVTNRKYILWPQLREGFSWRKCLVWGRDFLWSTISGYGTKPMRTVLLGLIVSLVYALIYWVIGSPEMAATKSAYSHVMSALYLSLTTFSTLGYGDITYGLEHPIMRLVTTSEAWFGAIMIALLVVVIARKIIRRY